MTRAGQQLYVLHSCALPQRLLRLVLLVLLLGGLPSCWLLLLVLLRPYVLHAVLHLLAIYAFVHHSHRCCC